MSLHPMVCADATVAASQNVQVLEFFFKVVNPDGTAFDPAVGAILPLIAAQSSASARVHLGVAGTGSATAAKPAAAAVEALIKRPNGNSLSATEENIKSGMTAYLGEVVALADGAAAITFAVGGLNAREVLAVELIATSGAVQDCLNLAQVGPSVRIPEPVTLNGGKLAKVGGAAAALATDKLLLVGGELNGSSCTVAGCLIPVESDKVALSAANTVKLRLTVRN